MLSTDSSRVTTAPSSRNGKYLGMRTNKKSYKAGTPLFVSGSVLGQLGLHGVPYAVFFEDGLVRAVGLHRLQGAVDGIA
ncbi:hypothetical protein D9M70_506710 [compost metagenome]